MAIVVIDGKADRVREMATMLRNAQIAAGKGALLLLRPGTVKGQEHELSHQIEKIMAGQPLPQGAKVEGIDWKPGVMVIVPKTEEDLLPKLEALVAGFTKHFGPIARMTV